MKIQYLVNWSFTYECRMSSFIRALSLPSSSASLSCAVALNNIQCGSATQNAPKLTIAPPQTPPQWGGGHPFPHATPLGAFGTSALAFGTSTRARTPQL